MNPKKIVILGGGFGGTYTFRALHKYFHRDKSVQIILVNKTNYFLFTPLLHEAATGGVLPHHVVEPIRKVLGCCLADFYQTEAKKIGLKSKTITTSLGKIDYDYLVMALGSQANVGVVPGAKENCFTLKTLEDAQRLKKHFINVFEQADKTKSKKVREKLLRFVVVGGGPTGVELAAEMSELFLKTMRSHHKKSGLISNVQIILVQKNKELLPQFSKSLRKTSKSGLSKLKVDLKLGVGVKKVTKASVTLDNGEKYSTSTVIWAGGVKTNGIKYDVKPKMAPDGRLLINKFLQVKGYKNVFAIGDMADGYPALAQVATRQANTAANNVKQLIKGKSLKAFEYKHEGYLLSMGQWNAIGEIRNHSVKGAWVWWVYRTVYLSKLLSWQKKLSVVVDWTINIFSPRDISEV